MKLYLPLLACLLAACGDHSDAHGGGGHSHDAQFGGTLVELGDHFANLEVLYDADEGTIRLYLLDGHAEDVVKGAQAEIPLSLRTGGTTVELVAKPVVSALAGNEVGSSSEFAVTRDDLAGLETFDLTVHTVEVLGSTFTDVAYHHPGSE